MTDRDGSILYETEDQRLFSEIIRQDDVEFLEKYFTIRPSAIPKLHSRPDEDESIYDMSLTFYDAIEDGSLGVFRSLMSHELEYTNPTEIIRFERFGFQLLNEAARWGHLKMVKFFLDNQPLYAGIQERDCMGNTALASAADMYNHRYVRYP
ncbi:hypothetical protein ACHAPI_004463 [Fusarium lateritium]